VKETKSTKKVGDICIASVISRGSLSTGMVGFTVKKGKVDAYGRCISDNSILYSPNALNASAHEYWTTNRDLGTVSV
jgi:hypothetical protein